MEDDIQTLREEVKAKVRNIPDFPKKGILFRDITPVLRDGALFRRVCDALASLIKNNGCTSVVGIESRGFLLAAPAAAMLEIPLGIIRKPGKLPWKTRRAVYSLEYGEDAVEIHEDAIAKGDRVALVDDVLATGGTMEAATRLVKELGGEVTMIAFLIELRALEGRKRLQGYNVHSLIEF
jgi:adenine phosphoribosyltransferase